MPYYVYILRTTDNKLYIGQTNNLAERLKQHSSQVCSFSEKSICRQARIFGRVYNTPGSDGTRMATQKLVTSQKRSTHFKK